jgi:hypothetical protein
MTMAGDVFPWILNLLRLSYVHGPLILNRFGKEQRMYTYVVFLSTFEIYPVKAFHSF